MRLFFRKILCWSLVLGFFPTLFSAAEPTAASPAVTLKREIGKCALLWQRQDMAGIVSYLPERVIAKSGGRVVVLRELKEQFAEARSYGVQRLEVQPGKIASLQPFGEWLASVVPITAVLHGPHVDLTQQTHVLAVSQDRGKHWFFIVLYQRTQTELNTWFPEFAGKIKVPVAPDPQMEMVY